MYRQSQMGTGQILNISKIIIVDYTLIGTTEFFLY
jgi:hypothetical protein